MGDPERDTGFLDDLAHGLNFRWRTDEGFLAEDHLGTGARGIDHHTAVKTKVGADADDIRLFLLQHLAVIDVALSDLEPGVEGGEVPGVDVGRGRDPDPGDAVKSLRMVVADFMSAPFGPGAIIGFADADDGGAILGRSVHAWMGWLC